MQEFGLAPDAQPARPKVFALALILAAAVIAPLAGCGSGGGPGAGSVSGSATGTSTSTGTSTTTGTGPTQASLAHRNAALAALGSAAQQRAPVVLTQASIAAWNRLLEESWPVTRRLADEQVERLLRAQAAALTQTAVQVLALHNLVIDTAAPPALAGTDLGAAQRLQIAVPRWPGAWRLACTAEVGTVQTINVFGIGIPVTVSFDVSVDVSDIRIEAQGDLDVTHPERPLARSVAAPQASMTLTLSSQSPLLSTVLPALTAILDPVIRVALVGGAIYAQQQVGQLLPTFNPAPWGTGAPPAAGVPGAPDLRRFSEDISTEILLHHMPDSICVPVKFDDPRFGFGNVVETKDHADAGDWTGRYVAAEAYRWDLTGDPRALAGARKGLDGIEACVETVANQAPALGLISRYAIPLTSPWIGEIRGQSDYFEGTFRGVPYASLDDISRDKYISIAHVAGTVWCRLPSERPRAARMAGLACDYVVQHAWNCFRADGQRLAIGTPFSQTPSVVWDQIATAALCDPAAYGGLFAQWQELPDVMWLNTWASSREVFDDYFKFELSYAELANLFQIEASGARYREYAKSLEIFDDVVGHHDNAWFDAIHGAAVPGQAATRGARVKNALERFTLRPRRGFSTDLANDPTVAKQQVISYVISSNTQSIAPTPRTVAQFPVPIEKRPSTDFLWQRCPFDLRSSFAAEQQWVGLDMICPYWMGACYGMVP